MADLYDTEVVRSDTNTQRAVAIVMSFDAD
jgi:hypothetical protein